MDEEAQALLDEYEKSGDPDIAGHLIEYLDSARRAKWEESTVRMNFTRISWALLRCFGAAQRPPQSARPPVSANKVASHLVQVAKAPTNNKAFGCQVHCTRWMAPGTSKLCNRASSSGNLARRSGQCFGANEIRNSPGYALSTKSS